jgi:hypothetical protein
MSELDFALASMPALTLSRKIADKSMERTVVLEEMTMSLQGISRSCVRAEVAEVLESLNRAKNAGIR